MIQLTRTIAIAAVLTVGATTVAMSQRSRGGGGTMGSPRASQPTRPSASSPAASSPSRRGTMSVPAGSSVTAPRGGNLPRIVTAPPRRGGSGYTFGNDSRGYARTYNSGSRYGGYGSYDGYPRGDRGTTRFRRQPYTRWGVGGRVGCGYGCFRIGAGVRTGGFFGSLFVGYPFGAPVFVPYIVETTVVQYEQPVAEPYTVDVEPQPEPARSASKVIVVGGSGGGDALTVETFGDSVRLNWLAAGRAAREVRLFVADSARRELAARSASPSAPVATFETETLSAPVAFAGVSVTFTDGVVTTTVVPYQRPPAGQRR